MMYNYYCTKCGNTFEEDMSVENRRIPCGWKCALCGGTISKAIDAPFFRVHGFAARNGYSDTVGDIEAFTGHEYKPEVDD